MIYVDGDGNATGYGTLTATARHIAASADTLDILIGGADSSAGKIRVWAVMCDVSGVDEDDNNTDAQARYCKLKLSNLGGGVILLPQFKQRKNMSTINLTSTQKIYKPKTVGEDKVKDLENRMKIIEQTLNLILKKLDN